MTPLVLDASAALSFVLPSQGTPQSEQLIAELGEHHLHAPYVFEWEVRNVLLSLRRRTLRPTAYAEALEALARLEVAAEPPLEQGVLPELSAFAHLARLSLFDATYLALALENAWPLASRDGVLLDRCRVHGVEVIDLR